MNIAEYENKIALYTTKIEIANLTYSILKAVTKKELSVSEAKPLIETYLGGLPATNRNETFKDLGLDIRKGIYKKVFDKKHRPLWQLLWL